MDRVAKSRDFLLSGVRGTGVLRYYCHVMNNLRHSHRRLSISVLHDVVGGKKGHAAKGSGKGLPIDRFGFFILLITATRLNSIACYFVSPVFS